MSLKKNSARRRGGAAGKRLYKEPFPFECPIACIAAPRDASGTRSGLSCRQLSTVNRQLQTFPRVRSSGTIAGESNRARAVHFADLRRVADVQLDFVLEFER